MVECSSKMVPQNVLCVENGDIHTRRVDIFPQHMLT